MNSKKLHFVLIGVLGLLFVALLVGAFQVNSAFKKQSADLTKLKAISLAHDKQKIALAKAKRDVEKYNDLEKITKTIVPEDKSQAEAVREIVNLASKNGISLASISFPASDLGTGPAPKAGASTQPTAVENKANSLSQLLPVKNISGVYQLTINVNGDPNKPIEYSKLINFLSDLEQNRRTAQVNTISLSPVTNSTSSETKLTFNITLNEYIKP